MEKENKNLLNNYHHGVLSKGRSFPANSGAKVADLPKGMSSTANSVTKVEVLRIGALVSRCFPYPTLPLASEQTLKDLKRSQQH